MRYIVPALIAGIVACSAGGQHQGNGTRHNGAEPASLERAPYEQARVAGGAMTLCSLGEQSLSAAYGARIRTPYAGSGRGDFDRAERDLVAVREIAVETFQFGFSPRVIRVNRGDRIVLQVTTRDVAHGIEIRDLGISVPVSRGETRCVSFIVNKPGRFSIRCPVYCGEGHERMKALLVVEDRAS